MAENSGTCMCQTLAHAIACQSEQAAAEVGVQPVILQTRGFLLAWGGVLALSFCDWPPFLQKIKNLLNGWTEGGALAHLAAENAGSRWPKITIGALRPGATLSLSDLTNLRRVTDDFKSRLQQQRPPRWEILKMHVTAYTSRSLEHRITDEPVLLPTASSCSANDRDEAPSRNRFVEEVMQEWEDGDLTHYLERVNSGTNSLHYTRKTSLDYTLVAFLLSNTTDAPTCCANSNLQNGDLILDVMKEFGVAVEEACPGKFDLFALSSPACLHMTIRSLHRDL